MEIVEHGLWNQRLLVYILAYQFSGRLTLGKLCSLSELSFLIRRMKIMPPPSQSFGRFFICGWGNRADLRPHVLLQPELTVNTEVMVFKKHERSRNPIIAFLGHGASLYQANTFAENDAFQTEERGSSATESCLGMLSRKGTSWEQQRACACACSGAGCRQKEGRPGRNKAGDVCRVSTRAFPTGDFTVNLGWWVGTSDASWLGSGLISLRPAGMGSAKSPACEAMMTFWGRVTGTVLNSRQGSSTNPLR